MLMASSTWVTGNWASCRDDGVYKPMTVTKFLWVLGIWGKAHQIILDVLPFIQKAHQSKQTTFNFTTFLIKLWERPFLLSLLMPACSILRLKRCNAAFFCIQNYSLSVLYLHMFSSYNVELIEHWLHSLFFPQLWLLTTFISLQPLNLYWVEKVS